MAKSSSSSSSSFTTCLAWC